MDISIRSSTGVGDSDVDMFDTTGDSNREYDSDELEDLPSFVNNEDDEWDELDTDMFDTTGDSNREYDCDELEDLPSFVNNEDDEWDELDTGVDAEDLLQEDFEQQLATSAISSSGTGDESAPTATMSQCCHKHLCSIETFPLFGSNEMRKSKRYFWQDYIHYHVSGERFGGLRGLTWRSINRLETCDNESMLSLDDSVLMFEMMDHALNNKGEQKEVFYDIVCNLFSKLSTTQLSAASLFRDLEGHQEKLLAPFVASLNSTQNQHYVKLRNAKPVDIRVPHSEKEAKKMLLEGQFGMFSNLPTPRVYEMSGHAVVCIDSLFDIILAQGVPIQYLQDEHGNIDNTTVNGSVMGKRLYEEWKEEVGADSVETRFGLVLLWSDGFVRAWVKRKNNNVWIMTLTVPNTEKNSTSEFHTYCIALGKSSLDHTPVISHMMEQLKAARKIKHRYCGRSGKIVKTAVGVHAYSSDRTERCAVLQTLFLGDYGLRSHFASGVDTNTLPMCPDCFKRVTDSLQRDIHPAFDPDLCQNCCRWDYSRQSTIAPPKDYPTFASTDSPEPPIGRAITDSYIAATRQSFPWLIKGLEYAHHNLSTERHHWSEKHSKAFLRTMAIGKIVQRQVYMSARHKRSHPNDDILPFIPTLWSSGFPIERFLNSPMHLLFEGIVSSVMDLIESFTKKLNLNSDFNRFANKFLSEIGDKLRLDWCRVRSFPHTEWLAEDFLGLSRILPSVFELFLLNNPMSQEHASTAQSIHQLLNALHVMMSSLMGPSYSSDHQRIEIYVKIFLSTCHKASQMVHGDAKWWVSKGNFLSLLNLSEQVKLFGCVRWYYEGVSERFIQVVKPHLTTNLRKTIGYFLSKLTFIHATTCIKWIKNGLKQGVTDNINDDNTLRQHKGYYRYRNLATIQEKFNEGFPISAIRIKNTALNVVFVAVGTTREMSLVPIRFELPQEEIITLSIPWNDCTLCDSDEVVNRMNIERQYIEQEIDTYCLLFPCKRGGDGFEHKFACVFSDWDVITKHGKKGQSLLSWHVLNATEYSG